jgi:hypothetical protein
MKSIITFGLMAITNERGFNVDKILTYTKLFLFSDPENIRQNVRKGKRGRLRYRRKDNAKMNCNPLKHKFQLNSISKLFPSDSNGAAS